MKRSINKDEKHYKKQKLLTISKACKILDTIDVRNPRATLQTPCGKFLIVTKEHHILKYCLKTKQNYRIAGQLIQCGGYQDGTRNESIFDGPEDLTLSKDLKTLFVADTWNRVIRAICVQTGITTTFAGQVGKYGHVDGPKERACFSCPSKLKLSSDGNTLYVADGSKIRTICIETGQVNTIGTFNKYLDIYNLSISPDGKHIYICNYKDVFKYNVKTGKSEIILKGKGYIKFCISKYGQLLFILKKFNKDIEVVDLETNQVIGTINTPFDVSNLEMSTNEKQLYVCCYFDNKILICDISKYYINFKTFLQLQLSKYSFLPSQVVNLC
jgi:DNA-binding beta-propeller fold protein YncE